MNHGLQNSTGNPATAVPPQTDSVVFAKSDESGKGGRKDHDTHKVNKKKRALPQEAKEAKKMKLVKEELGSTGEELKQFNAVLSNIQSEIIEIRMGCRLVLQKMARQEELMVDILNAMEEDDLWKFTTFCKFYSPSKGFDIRRCGLAFSPGRIYACI